MTWSPGNDAHAPSLLGSRDRSARRLDADRRFAASASPLPDRRHQCRVGGEPSDRRRPQSRAQGARARRWSRRDVRHPLHGRQTERHPGRRRGSRQSRRRSAFHQSRAGDARRQGCDRERADRIHAGERSCWRRHRHPARSARWQRDGRVEPADRAGRQASGSPEDARSGSASRLDHPLPRRSRHHTDDHQGARDGAAAEARRDAERCARRRRAEAGPQGSPPRGCDPGAGRLESGADDRHAREVTRAARPGGLRDGALDRLRRPHLVWTGLLRPGCAGRRAGREDLERRPTSGFASRRRGEDRPRGEPQDGRAVWLDRAAEDPAAGRRLPTMTTRPSRGRLFRKYVVVLLVLVGGVLMISGLVDLYFSYRETQRAIVRVERAKAVAAAAHIEQFLKEIEVQVRETTRTASDDPDASQVGPGRLGFREGLGTALAQQRELDFVRVLRNVPAVAQLSHLDLAGKEQLRVSRLDLDVVGSQEDFSKAPAFVTARTGKTYWSPVYLKNDAEPYTTLGVPVGKYAVEVTTAEVSLRPVLKIVTQIEVGPGGYAYVVDSSNHLVAHPDGRMLRMQRDLSALEQVKSARAEHAAASTDTSSMVIANGLGGGRMLAAHAAIAPLDWLVFVERPAADAYAPLRAPIIRSVAIFVLGLGLSVLASILLARRMVAPIRMPQEGAARIGAGELGHRIAVRTGAKRETLGDELNKTAGQLQESYSTLEHRVEERTRELEEANAGLEESLEQQTATGEILRVISSSPTDIQPVLDAVAESAARLCEAFDATIFLRDDDRLVLAAHRGPIVIGKVGQFTLPLSRGLVVGRAVLDARTIHLADMQTEGAEFPEGAENARHMAYRSLLVVPLMREGAAIGVVGVRRTEAQKFTDRQVALLETFADQAVIAIQNVRLFKELEARNSELKVSLEQLQALGEVTQAVSSTLELETVLATIVSRAVQLSGSDQGLVYEFADTTQDFHQRAAHQVTPEHVEALRATPVRLGEGAMGRAGVTRQPVQVGDIEADW